VRSAHGPKQPYPINIPLQYLLLQIHDRRWSFREPEVSSGDTYSFGIMTTIAQLLLHLDFIRVETECCDSEGKLTDT
jgi:hypothetical protein